MPSTAALPLCISENHCVTWGAFAAQVAAYEARFDATDIVYNRLSDRSEFMAALMAAMLTGATTVLPGLTPRDLTIKTLPGGVTALDLDNETTPPESDSEGFGDADVARLLARIVRAPGEVFVFTSGSTGDPVRHVKRWKSLAGGAEVTEELIADREGMRSGSGATLIIGTTPHAHMYGLEATVLEPIAFQRCVYRPTVFYPADLEKAAAVAKEQGFDRIALITCPAHIKYLEETIFSIPEIAVVVSAAAPLSVQLARRLETREGLSVREIYGSTETGSLAGRCTATEESWQPLVGFEITQDEDGRSVARAPHLDAAVPMNDVIKLLPDGRFRLDGRLGDMVQIAGKRTSLGTLNSALLDANEISDGTILSSENDGEDCLTALVVRCSGSDLSNAEIIAAIRRHLAKRVDPVFVPQHVRVVGNIPRNASGKITMAELRDLI